ncbi:hypothetical protein LAZ67_1007788 [Cordylochernes scorpioides]|uniref:Ig-like domain-containing protein n=1 Tax=Cordylochernes scorpioides TaxID=51811 RepID=A0ABY6K2J9_9ARAC|nr:hypothetical protein LAZ67_1007788 [Cordylochernes scorpioides]
MTPAKFAEKFAVVRARRGDSASLTCEALGDQPVGITWRKDDRYLSKTGEARYSSEYTIGERTVYSKEGPELMI